MYSKTHCIILSMAIFTAVLFGCNGQSSDKASTQSLDEVVSLPNEDVILATVNGTNITEYDLEQAIQTTFGDSFHPDAEARQKILESLVTSRAISQARTNVMTPEEKATLVKKTEGYKEQLLVKQYLSDQTTPEPVTQEMVEEYYNSHTERFGGKTLRTYEMIMSTREMTQGERDKVMAALGDASEKKEWKAFVEPLKAKGYPVSFRQGQTDEKLLEPQLKQIMSSLKKGEVSNLSFVQGTAYLVRIVEEEKVSPRPLKEVSAEIRKTLVPIQLKKAVKEASKKVLETAEVVYY